MKSFLGSGDVVRFCIRGIERRKIFINDRDREDMRKRPVKLLPETQTACYAWVLIPNYEASMSPGRSSAFQRVHNRLCSSRSDPQQ